MIQTCHSESFTAVPKAARLFSLQYANGLGVGDHRVMRQCNAFLTLLGNAICHVKRWRKKRSCCAAENLNVFTDSFDWPFAKNLALRQLSQHTKDGTKYCWNFRRKCHLDTNASWLFMSCIGGSGLSCLWPTSYSSTSSKPRHCYSAPEPPKTQRVEHHIFGTSEVPAIRSNIKEIWRGNNRSLGPFESGAYLRKRALAQHFSKSFCLSSWL